MKLIEALRGSLKMDIRPNSQGLEYLEAVVNRSDLELLRSLLGEHLGPPAKEAGTEANLPMEIEGLVDSMGGLRIEQSFFYKKGEDNRILFAALWPWKSNPENITLKAGEGLF